MSHTKRTVVVLLLLWHGPSLASLDEIERRLRAGDAEQAYQAALALSTARAGDPAFDLLFGLAALESGHLDQAAFALERVLIAQPGHHRARLELARTHFLLKDYHAARREFEAVLAQRPPPNVQARIEGFLAQIDRQGETARHRVQGFVELTLGSDSNVNSATSDGAVQVPALGQVTLDAASRETDAEFAELSAGVELSYRSTKQAGLFGSLAFKDRSNAGHGEFDTRVLGLRAGLAMNVGASVLRVPFQYQRLDVDGERFRRMQTVGIEWERDFTNVDRLSAFGQFGVLRFEDQPTRDVDLRLFGAGWTRRIPNLGLTLTGSGYFGDERASEPLGEHNGRQYLGARAALQRSLGGRQLLYAAFSAQRVRHDGVHPVFATTRHDRFRQLSVGWAWEWASGLLLRVALDHYDNPSNIDLYEYDRTQLAAGIRYGF